MLKLKTKTEFQVPGGRCVKSVIVRMIVSHSSLIDINNVKLEGYYYFIDENGTSQKLPDSDFGQSSMKLWDEITALENMENSPLANLCSVRNLKDVFFQRLKELVFLQLQQEAGENYGTNASDWEIDTE